MNNLDFSVALTAFPYLADGLRFSLTLTAVGCIAGIILGTALALIQHFDLPFLARAARTYIAVIRSIPLILVLFWFFFLVPSILSYFSPSGQSVPLGPYFTAFLTFSLFEAAYYSEIIRAGLRTVNKGQFEACDALGLSPFDAYASVVLPQVFRAAAPIILNQTIILFQDTSLVYVLSLNDLVGVASKVAQLNGRMVEMYLVVAVVYLTICVIASQFVSLLKKRTSPRSV